MALIKLCTPAMERGQDSLLDRIRAGRGKGREGNRGCRRAAGPGESEKAFRSEPDICREKVLPAGGYGSQNAGVRQVLPDAIPEDVQEVVKNFRSIAGEASGMVRGYLKKSPAESRR